MLMVHIFTERPGEPSWFVTAMTALVTVLLGLLYWAVIYTFVLHKSPVPALSRAMVPDKPMVRSVKTIAIGPDPLAEPDPLASYSGKP